MFRRGLENSAQRWLAQLPFLRNAVDANDVVGCENFCGRIFPADTTDGIFSAKCWLSRARKKCAGVPYNSHAGIAKNVYRTELNLNNRTYRTCVDTCAAVDAAVVDNPFVTCLTDRAYRTGIITCCAVNALLVNRVSQSIHLLFGNILTVFSVLKISYRFSKV
jgi:hypothetical protein